MPEPSVSESPREMREPRERINFGKIRTQVSIPNLIEVQKHSYERFLQMFVAPSDREDTGLQSVFKSVFPIHDFRETSSLEFVEYSIGNWECKCGALQGIEKIRCTCASCGKRVIAINPNAATIPCPECGTANKNTVEICDHCGDPVGLKFKYDVAECQERGMHFTVPLKVTIRLVVWDKDPETGSRSIRDIKQQEVYFGEIPMLTRARHLHHQRHRARHRQPAPSLPGRLLPGRGEQDPLHVQDHPVPRLLGGVRVRPEGPALRPDRPEAQVPRNDLHARPWHQGGRGDPAHLLPRAAGAPRRQEDPLEGEPRADEPQGQGGGGRSEDRRGHRPARQAHHGPAARRRCSRPRSRTCTSTRRS